MSNTPPTLILDATQKSALAATRALGQQGIPVVTAAATPRALASWSRYSRDFVQCPSPKADLTDFVAWLIAYAQDCPVPPVIYAFSDATHLAIARNRRQLEDTIAFSWNHSVFLEQAFSKTATYTLATELGIPTIEAYAPDAVADFPVVVKPYTSVSWASGKGTSGTAEFAFSAAEYEELRHIVQQVTGQEPIVQAFLTGDEYGVEVLAQDGAILRQFAHKRIRSLSPRGGAAVVKETARTSQALEQMERYTAELITALQWTGPAMVEFKIDEATDQPVLMEINGRFWGSLPLAEVAGAQFVSGYYELLTGEVTTKTPSYRHERTQHWLGDLRWLLAVWFARDQLRTVLYPSRLRALASFLFDTLCTRGDVFWWRDPLPMLGELVSIRSKRKQP